MKKNETKKLVNKNYGEILAKQINETFAHKDHYEIKAETRKIAHEVLDDLLNYFDNDDDGRITGTYKQLENILTDYGMLCMEENEDERF